MKIIHVFWQSVPFKVPNQIVRMMKLTAIIMTTLLLQVSASSIAQKVTLNKKNLTLKTTLKEISRQTGYNILWSSVKLNDKKRIDVSLTEELLEKALDKVLFNEPFTYTIKDKTIVISEKKSSFLDRIANKFLSQPKEIDVTGHVIDEKGQPLAGASVSVKKTNKITLTNNQGYFQLRAIPDTATLIISYVGYKTKEVVAYQAKPIVVTLEVETSILEGVNVVSTGYQRLPKERATGAFDLVDNKLFNRTTGTDVISRLNGTIPGLLFTGRSASPKSLAAATIRGISSFSVQQPLVVLDNIAYEGDVNNINPNDVENITVLKDAAAASIWGTKAGNGVIVITTKKGRYEKPINISLNANITVSEKPDLFSISQINGSDFIDVEKFLFRNKYYDSKITRTVPFRPFLTPVVELLAKQRALPIDDVQGRTAIDQQIDTYRQYDVRNDYEKYIYKNQVNQQYALNISGGGKQSNYYVSGGLDKNLNNIISSNVQRVTLRSDYNFKPLKNLEFQTGFYFTQNKSNALGGNNPVTYRSGVMSAVYPYARFTDDQGNAAITGVTYGIEYNNNLANNPNLLDWRYKILDDINKSRYSTKGEDLQLNLGTTYNINSVFSGDIKYQYRTANSYTEEVYDQNSYYVRDLVNTYTAPANYIDPMTGLPAPYKRAIPLGGIYNPSHGKTNSQTLRGQFNVNKTWNDVHQLVAIAGAEIRKSYGTGNSEGIRYGYDPNTKTFQTVDYLNSSLPLYYGGTASIPYGAAYGDNSDRSTSLFTNASYTYNNRYILSASARRDASNVFGTRSNKKGAPLWSAGFSWNVSNEAFYKSDLIPYMKLRATYGFSGNTVPGIPAYALASLGVTNVTQLPYARSQNLPNPDLRWEKVGTFNLGLDFNTKNNRISGTINYYRKKSTDVITSSPVDPTTGYELQSFNSANIKGHGVEINLHSINLTFKNFDWSTDYNFTYNRNIVSKYFSENSNGLTYTGATSGVINPIEGKDAYAIFAFRWAGLDPLTGDPQGYLDKNVSKDYNSLLSANVTDLKYYGSSIAPYYGALRNNFSYQNLTITANITYKFGYYFRRSGINYSSLFASNTGVGEFANRWKNPGDEKRTNVPSMVFPSNSSRDSFYNFSEAVIDKGDHIRLQDISASYNFNNILGMKSCRFYAIVNNLGLIWKANKHDIDPDILSGYKAPKTFSIGFSTNL